MNYYGAKDLARSFRTVRGNTITIASEIGEEHYGFRATPDTRTVAQVLIHIANVPKLQLQLQAVERVTTLEGFDFMAFLGPVLADEQKPYTKAQILERLKTDGESFAQWLETLPDSFLGEIVTMRAGMEPAEKTRFEMILGVKEHEMHHRAQLMQIERMLGITPHLTRQMQARFAAQTAR
ncbi:MAG TPA: DinB family protein [Bryobacteraceae bacterium]|nr:DinB family protein [Bryobacteraceae bacterium]